MTKKIIIFIFTCLLSCGYLLPVNAQYAREYTQDHPLIIVSDWEFPPYEFRNDRGEPDGYNVEVLNLVLNKLNIPHQFVMQEWYQATKTFENREADLIHALSGFYRKSPYVITQNMITYYPLKSVRRKDQDPLQKISRLTADDTLMVKKNDYAPLSILQTDPQFTLEYHSPKEALTSIRNGKNSYFIWGELPLKMKIREFGLDSLLVLDDIDIPVGEGERQEKVSEGIREIISQSEVGKELKQPVEGSLKEIADAFLNYFPVGVAKGDLESSGITYHLWIENKSQNSEAVFFRVEDGIFGNGGPSVRYATIRLSDGKVMDNKDVYNITGDDIVALVKKYGANEQKEVYDNPIIQADSETYIEYLGKTMSLKEYYEELAQADPESLVRGGNIERLIAYCC